MLSRVSSIALCLVLMALAPSVATAASRTVLLLGDSLSAAQNIQVSASWPALLGQRLARQHPPYRLVNASISGETTSSGITRLPALLKQYRPGIVMLELGANDALRGLPLDEIRTNLAAMVTECQKAGARVLLLGIEMPVNYGPQYRDGLRAIYTGIARRDHTGLLPFLLEGVALDPKLMQADGLHPTAAAQPKVLANVWGVLQPMLRPRK